MPSPPKEDQTDLLYQFLDSRIYRTKHEGAPAWVKHLTRPAGVAQYLLKKERTLLTAVTSPHVPRIIGTTVFQDQPALVFQPFPGADPKPVTADRPWSLDRFLAFAASLTRILSSVHQAKVVHQNLSLDCLLTTPQSNQLLLLGFHNADFSQAVAQNIDGTGHLAHQLHYLSPEQSGRMNSLVDYRADYYALGIIFYKLLTGRFPFDSSDPMAMIHAHLAQAPPPPSSHNVDVPQPLWRLVAKLLAKRPEQRYQRLKTLLSDLATCTDAWEQHRHIPDFPLAKQEHTTELEFGGRLFGRDPEVQLLHQNYDTAKQGRTRVVLIAGVAGIGKTRLVHQLRQRIATTGEMYTNGKYEQLKRDIPYSGLIQAFRNLMLQLLTGKPATVSKWGTILSQTLGAAARAVAQVIPELHMLIDPMPPLPALPAAQETDRFRNAFHLFVTAFFQHGHSLALFLDDLQWADFPTFQLLHQILSADPHQPFLLIGAYRDDEIDPYSGLPWLLEQMDQERVEKEVLRLKPLRQEAVLELIQEPLATSAQKAQPLAEIVHEKTGGNPFYIREFLRAVHARELIYFDPMRRQWQFDLGPIKQHSVTLNLAKETQNRLQSLPSAGLEVIQVAACLGTRFSSELLIEVTGHPAAAVNDALNLLKTSGFITPIEDINRLFGNHAAHERNRGTNNQTPKHEFLFLHDLIQQAAYDLMPAEHRDRVLYDIGITLIRGVGKSGMVARCFELLEYFNNTEVPREDDKAAFQLAKLNLIGAKLAKRSTAFQSSLLYLEAAQNLLEKRKTREGLQDRIQLEMADCHYMLEAYEAAETLFQGLKAKSTNPSLRLTAHHKHVNMVTLLGNREQGLAIGLEALTLAGIPNFNPPKWHALIRFLVTLGPRFRHFHKADWSALPKLNDAKIKDQLSVIFNLFPAAFFVDKKTWFLLLLSGTHLSLRHGRSDLGFFFFAYFGLISSMITKNVPRAVAYLDKAIGYFSQSKALQHMGACLFFKGMLNHRREHLKENLTYFGAGIKYSLQSGDRITLSYNIGQSLTTLMMCGLSAEKVRKKFDRLQTYKDRGSELEEYYASVAAWITAMEQGFLDEHSILNQGLKESDRHHQTTIALFHMVRLLVLCRFGLFEEAWPAVRFLTADGKTGNSAIVTDMAFYDPTFYLYKGLACSALLQGGNPPKDATPKVLNQSLRIVAKYVRAGAAHYQCFVDFLRAEQACVQGNTKQALQSYEKAVAGARNQEYRHITALALLRAVTYLRSTDHSAIANALDAECAGAFADWGYVYQPARRPEPSGLLQNIGGLAAGFDLNSVVKASETLFQEVVFDDLLISLMNILIENGNAEKGFLAFKKNNDWIMMVRGEIGKPGTLVNQPITQLSATEFPEPVFQFVVNTNEILVLEKANSHAPFAGTPYIVDRQLKSVLCMPLLKQNGLIGVLYLENNLVTGAFPPSRVESLKVICSMAVTSTENARLVADLETKNRGLAERVAERTAEVRARYQELITLSTIVKNIHQHMDLNQLLETLLKQGIALLPEVGRATVLLPELFGGRYQVHSVDTDGSIKHRLLRPLASEFSETIEQINPVWEEDIALLPDPTPVNLLLQQSKAQCLLVIRYQTDREADAWFLWEQTATTQSPLDTGDIRRMKRFRHHLVAAMENAAVLQQLKVKNKNITDSLQYAQKIQNAILPAQNTLQQSLPEHFVLFRPRDIVSGDFYFCKQVPTGVMLACIDCTGHGVPGAFMAMVGYTLLNKIVVEDGVTRPSQGLTLLDQHLRDHLYATNQGLRDGMDMSLCHIGHDGRLAFSGAFSPIYLYQPGLEKPIRYIRGTRRSIGGKHRQNPKPFEEFVIQMGKGDGFYLLSDGYVDQRNADGIKLGSKRLKTVLPQIASLPMDTQLKHLEDLLDLHQDQQPQQDDITVIGVKF